MAKYLVLIYEDEAGYAKGGQAAYDQVMAAHNTFNQANSTAILGGEALHPVGAATSIRKNADGSFAVTDGPFAETKEALGGYYLVEAADLDAAIATAKQVPAIFGGVEVRPIMVFN